MATLATLGQLHTREQSGGFDPGNSTIVYTGTQTCQEDPENRPSGW